jgi:hypothetical protein
MMLMRTIVDRRSGAGTIAELCRGQLQFKKEVVSTQSCVMRFTRGEGTYKGISQQLQFPRFFPSLFPHS